MKFMCEDEEVKIRDLEHFTGKDRKELYELGKKTGHNNILKIDGYEYKIVEHGVFKPKRKRGRPKEIHMSNVTESPEKVNGCKKEFYVDAKKITSLQLSNILKISEKQLVKYTNRKKSLTINGVDIVIKRSVGYNEERYTISKDGKKTKDLTIKQAVNKTGISKTQLLKIVDTGKYSTFGWKINEQKKKNK